MADNKKYYWIKLRTDFFNQDTIDFLLSQTNGCEYVVLYQMLMLNTANTGGRLESRIGEIIISYDVEKIVRDTKYFDTDTVIVALELYKKLGLIYESKDNCMILSSHNAVVGSESASQEAIKKREYRERKKLENMDISRDKDKDRKGDKLSDRDKSIEIRDKSIDIRDNKKIIAQSDKIAPDQEAIISLTLNDKSLYPIYQTQIDEWQELYPNVDILQQLRGMKGWLDANPTKRKTKAGIKRFINSWLAREQDKPSYNKSNQNYQTKKSNFDDLAF